MTFRKCLCVGDVSGTEKPEMPDRTDKDKDDEVLPVNLDQTTLEREEEREDAQDDTEPSNIQALETESSSPVALVEKLVTQATLETNLGSTRGEK